MAQKIYIAGKVSGEDYDKVIIKFATKHAELEAKGYKVINPVERLLEFNDNLRKTGDKPLSEEKDRTKILKIGIQWLLDCDAIYMLEDWTQSEGATMEHQIADTMGLEIQYENDFKISFTDYGNYRQG